MQQVTWGWEGGVLLAAWVIDHLVHFALIADLPLQAVCIFHSTPHIPSVSAHAKSQCQIW